MKMRNGSVPARSVARSKSQLQDDSIMGTNNSSIVSKRSVERLYFPDEPHFFRYFVKKPQRRSPLINRGYWLRMKAIDQVVRQFLEQGSAKKKVVINLGCGYDPLPWQCLVRYPVASAGVKFIDIDYRDLMIKKRAVVQSTKELNSMLANVERPEGDVIFKSDEYVQLGCDLRDLVGLQRTLAKVIDIENCTILFTAEVSITYMDLDSADALIGWASKMPEARFCLLEQLLPDGLGHPFSQTMMAHFNKLRTSLGAVRRYPTTEAQEGRFRGLGWPRVSVRNLWYLWGAPDFASSSERQALDSIESFDEWEEFAIFGCHYFLLVADSSSSVNSNGTTVEEQPENNRKEALARACSSVSALPGVVYSEYARNQGCRRFGAPMSTRGSDRAHDRVGVFGGMGLTTRMNSYDEYGTESAGYQPPVPPMTSATPSSRMCHTITDLGECGALLVGGRTSPDKASADCWFRHKWTSTWERVDDLPWPLYRHQATSLGHGYVLVSTGRIDSRTLSSKYLVWHRRTGWVKCVCEQGEGAPPSYGSVMISTPLNTSRYGGMTSSATGILTGGMSGNSCLLSDVWQWELSALSSEAPKICFKHIECLESKLVARFGASAVAHQGHIYIIGGVLKDSLLTSAEEVCELTLDGNTGSVRVVPIKLTPRPLLIGSTAVIAGESLVIMGGSAVCFSFGTFWTKGSYTIPISTLETRKSDEGDLGVSRKAWTLQRTITAQNPASNMGPITPTGPVSMSSVARVNLGTALHFSQVLQAGIPVIFEKSDIGLCVTNWSTEYLKLKVGPGREIIVHEASAQHMNFKSKNFTYATKPFGEFMDQIDNGEKLYLRSLSSENPSEQPADLSRDFPSIADDFRLPQELAFAVENAHSSPLRISGPVNMWLHYDVMANVLCQVRGSKRLLLFPPSDVNHFEFEPGSSSSPVNVFERLQENRLAGTSPYEALLEPGDILFIPALWLHTASPTAGVSIAVNVFFRNLSTGYAAGKDVYGNRDLQAYEKGRQDVAKIIKSFDSLPGAVRGFYLQRLADEVKQGI